MASDLQDLLSWLSPAHSNNQIDEHGQSWALVRARESLEAYKSNKSKNSHQSAPLVMHPVKTGADPPIPLSMQDAPNPLWCKFFFLSRTPLSPPCTCSAPGLGQASLMHVRDWLFVLLLHWCKWFVPDVFMGN